MTITTDSVWLWDIYYISHPDCKFWHNAESIRGRTRLEEHNANFHKQSSSFALLCDITVPVSFRHHKLYKKVHNNPKPHKHTQNCIRSDDSIVMQFWHVQVNQKLQLRSSTHRACYLAQWDMETCQGSCTIRSSLHVHINNWKFQTQQSNNI